MRLSWLTSKSGHDCLVYLKLKLAEPISNMYEYRFLCITEVVKERQTAVTHLKALIEMFQIKLKAPVNLALS